MKQGKPQKWQWRLAFGLIAVGLILLLPVFSAALRERLAPVLFLSGFIGLLMLWRQKEVYDDLPWEEQKELDREGRDDERKAMLRGRAAWLCWQGETVLFILGFLALLLFWDRVEFLQALPNWAFSMTLLPYWIRILIYELVHWRLEKKY